MRRPARNKLTGRPIDQVPAMFAFLSGSIAARYQELAALLQKSLPQTLILFLSRNNFGSVASASAESRYKEASTHPGALFPTHISRLENKKKS